MSEAAEAIAALSQVQPVATANCCKCGRIVDTRERSEGGDPFGAELNDGQWVCSIECWEAVVDTDATPPAPQPALALIEELVQIAGTLSGYYIRNPPTPDHEFVQVCNGDLRAVWEWLQKHGRDPIAERALVSAKRFKGDEK